MADTQKSFDLELLKTDSRLWKRLSTPVGRGRTLGNVFNEKENPFEKDGYAAMEMVKRLAAEGKLFVREDGRSRHYRKVEMDGEKMNLSNTFEAKTDLGGDPIYSGLMRASRAYFKWLGWDSLSNWFDKRVQTYDAVQARKKTYKEEYKNLSSKEKKALKQLRKQEKQEAKARQKLEALEKKTAAARKELNQILGKGEMESPLTQPTGVEKDKGSMQPVTLGDEPKNERKTEPVTPEATPTSKPEETKKEETKKEETQAETTPTPKPKEPKKSDFSLTVGGKEYTKENLQEAPENVRRILELLEALTAQLNQPSQPQKAEQPLQVEEGPKVEVLPKAEEPVKDAFQIEEGPKADIPPRAEAPKAEAFQIEEGPKVEMSAPLNEPPEVEKDKSPIQNRAPEEGTLPERLAEEKERMDSVRNWKEHLSNTLFSHAEGRDLLENYDLIKNDPQVGPTYLTTVAFGVLAQAGPENRQDVMEAMLKGESLGNDYDLYIRSGENLARQVSSDNLSGNSKPLEKLLTDTVRDLSVQASKEPQLSERHVMIGRLISNAMGLAEANELTLPLDERELAAAKGAVTLAKIAMQYHDARQVLGSGTIDMKSEKGDPAVRDLLMGNAVNTMIKQDQLSGDTMNSCQILMGTGIWSLENLAWMTHNSKVRRSIKPEQVEKLLENPNGSLAHKAAKSVNDAVILETEQLYKEKYLTAERAPERDMEQPAVHPVQV